MEHGFYMKAYLDLKKHLAMGVSVDTWIVERKEFQNKSTSTQYRNLGSVSEFLDWLRGRAMEEMNGTEFSSSMSPLVAGSRREGTM